MGWLFSSCSVAMLEILKAFLMISSQSVENKLQSKEAYLAGDGHGVESELGPWRSAGFH